MTYKNTTTGFVFNSPCEIKAEGWVKLDPSPIIKEEKKPVRTKKVKKNDE